jgi:glycosyltransferase involved in cell wall biosynthesis
MGKDGELSRLLELERPDVIYWRSNRRHLLRAVCESRKKKVPFVFAVSHINDVTAFSRDWPRPSRNLLKQPRFLAHVAKSMTSSMWNYQALSRVDAAIFQLDTQRLGPLSRKENRTIWNGVSDRKQPFEWERRFCVWVANIKPRKQPEAFMKLAGMMAERRPEIDFLMIGSVQDERYRRAIEAWEKLGNFHYLGYLPLEAVNGVLERAECLIHTCRPEGFPNNMIQAWRQGCPTISLEYDPDKIILSRGLGFVSGSLEKVANHVEVLVGDKALRDEIGSRAQSFARSYLTPERMVGQIESFLMKIVNEYNSW